MPEISRPAGMLSYIMVGVEDRRTYRTHGARDRIENPHPKKAALQSRFTADA